MGDDLGERMNALGKPEFTYSGQAYWFSRFVGHEGLNGPSVLSEYLSFCADCGAVFAVRTPMGTIGQAVSRRCDKHKKAGTRVRGVVLMCDSPEE